MIPMALVGDDAARQKLLEENLDRLLKNLEISSPVVAKDLIPPEGVEGTYRVSVAPDRFSATVDLFPPLGGGKPLDWITLVDELNDQGFVALLAESLSQAVDRCNQGAPQKGILVAQGIPPKLPREARLEILFSLEAPRETEEPPEDEDSQVDYRDRGHILAVREGDPLAILEPAEAGVPGVDVFGVPVPVEPPQDVRLLPGKGVILGEDGKTFVATQMGQPVLDGAVLRVDPVYVVSSDVDLGTGNVVFEGSVLVRGNVREGFVVTAGVDLEVFGNVEGARLQAARDVVIHGGLLGQGASVEAGRDVKARHVEHGKVYADRDILVTQYALHGSLFACGSILFQGRKGVIGGSLEAYDRIDVFTAGTPLGTKTHLLAGSHFRVRQQLGGVRERSEDLEAQTARIGSVIKTTLARYTRDGRPTLPPELADRMEKLLAHYNKLVEEARALEGRRHALEGLLRPQTSNKGIIKIRGTVYPGVLVEIRGKKREILDKQRFVSFYLDQDQQELTFGPYQ